MAADSADAKAPKAVLARAIEDALARIPVRGDRYPTHLQVRVGR